MTAPTLPFDGLERKCLVFASNCWNRTRALLTLNLQKGADSCSKSASTRGIVRDFKKIIARYVARPCVNTGLMLFVYSSQFNSSVLNAKIMFKLFSFRY